MELRQHVLNTYFTTEQRRALQFCRVDAFFGPLSGAAFKARWQECLKMLGSVELPLEILHNGKTFDRDALTRLVFVELASQLGR